jgi:orotidine-5'-phosphate decarboxylase
MHPFCHQLKVAQDVSKTSLCVGLDPDMSLLPAGIPRTVAGVRYFLEAVIETSLGRCAAFKPNISFFEAMGIEGLQLLLSLRERVPSTTPWIIDAKRGDIGNTSRMQARFLFDVLGADAVTLHPYMGEDSIVPFLEFRDKFSFVLGLTSNMGSASFQKQQMQNGCYLYETVLSQIKQWRDTFGNVGAVVGATQEALSAIQRIDPELLMLVPGVGAQGGSYQDVLASGKNNDGLVLINVSRAVLYDPGDNIQNFECNILQKLSIYRGN